MTGQLDALIDEITATRQDRLIKWKAVAAELGVTEGHLWKIRKGHVPITQDVAVAIDRFLGHARGTTWRLVVDEAGAEVDQLTGEKPGTNARRMLEAVPMEPADDELAEMTHRELAELAIQYQNERGPDARRAFLQRAKVARDKALDTLIAETAEASGPE
jgi:hypothetical protein